VQAWVGELILEGVDFPRVHGRGSTGSHGVGGRVGYGTGLRERNGRQFVKSVVYIGCLSRRRVALTEEDVERCRCDGLSGERSEQMGENGNITNMYRPSPEVIRQGNKFGACTTGWIKARPDE
jgi:hypothetical protein